MTYRGIGLPESTADDMLDDAAGLWATAADSVLASVVDITIIGSLIEFLADQSLSAQVYLPIDGALSEQLPGVGFYGYALAYTPVSLLSPLVGFDTPMIILGNDTPSPIPSGNGMGSPIISTCLTEV